MSKWEYMTLDSSTNYGTVKFYINGDQQPKLKNRPLYEIINQLGWIGWELVGVTTQKDAATYIFKREAKKAPVMQEKKASA